MLWPSMSASDSIGESSGTMSTTGYSWYITPVVTTGTSAAYAWSISSAPALTTSSSPLASAPNRDSEAPWWRRVTARPSSEK